MNNWVKKLWMVCLLCGVIVLAACSVNNEEAANKELNKAKKEEAVTSNDDAVVELFDTVAFSVTENEEEIGKFVVDLTKPQKEYIMDNELEVVFEQYFPDFVFQDREPHSQSDYPLNPAFIFTISNKDTVETKFIGIETSLVSEDAPIFDIEIVDVSLEEYSISDE